MTKVLDKLTSCNNDSHRNKVEEDRLEFQKHMVKDRSSYMNNKIQLETSRFNYEKQEKRLHLLRETRDMAMRDYCEEEDADLKKMLKDGVKKAQKKYMDYLEMMTSD